MSQKSFKMKMKKMKKIKMLTKLVKKYQTIKIRQKKAVALTIIVTANLKNGPRKKINSNPKKQIKLNKIQIESMKTND